MNFPKIGIITQARTGSTRLPAKIFLKASGKPLIQHHIDRLRWAHLPIFIATTTSRKDIRITEYADQQGLVYFTGSEENVLSRFYHCARENSLEIIVRVTSDCPLIDGNLIRKGVDQYLSKENQNLYLSNVLERTYPRGFDFEIFSFSLLEEAHKKATDPMDLEHVTPFINKNKSGRVALLHYKDDDDNSNLRVTLDTKEDYLLIQKLIETHHMESCGYKKIINFLKAHPELVKINAHIEQKKM